MGEIRLPAYLAATAWGCRLRRRLGLWALNLWHHVHNLVGLRSLVDGFWLLVLVLVLVVLLLLKLLEEVIVGGRSDGAADQSRRRSCSCSCGQITCAEIFPIVILRVDRSCKLLWCRRQQRRICGRIRLGHGGTRGGRHIAC